MHCTMVKYNARRIYFFKVFVLSEIDLTLLPETQP
jgi:hypothetical protein